MTTAEITGLAEALAGDFPTAPRLTSILISEITELGHDVPADEIIDTIVTNVLNA